MKHAELETLVTVAEQHAIILLLPLYCYSDSSADGVCVELENSRR